MDEYRYWLRRFADTGEVAFDLFIMAADRGDKTCYSRIETGQIYETNAIYIMSSEVGIKDEYLPFLVGFRGDRFTVDIPPGSRWPDFGIKRWTDLPQQKRAAIETFFAHFMLPLFAKIQTEALRSQKKIIRLSKMENAEKHQKQLDDGESRRELSRTIILSPGITYSIQPDSSIPKAFTRRCEAWGVRGHYRHYKDGKIVYIRPYQKGSGRIKQTTYAVREGE